MSMQFNVNRMSTFRRETLETDIVPPPRPGSTSMCSWILLSSLSENPRASIYLLCTCVCLVFHMKLFSKGIPPSKTFFTILGKGGIAYIVSVCVLAVSSSPRVFYSDSKIKYFPKNTSSRGTRLFAVYVVSIAGYLKVLLVSWKIVSHFRNTKIWFLLRDTVLNREISLLLVIFLSNTSSLGETRLGCMAR